MRRLAEANLRKVPGNIKFLPGTLASEFRGESPWIPWFPRSQSIYIYLIYSSQKKYIYKRGRREGIRIYKEFRLFYIEFEYPLYPSIPYDPLWIPTNYRTIRKTIVPGYKQSLTSTLRKTIFITYLAKPGSRGDRLTGVSLVKRRQLSPQDCPNGHDVPRTTGRESCGIPERRISQCGVHVSKSSVRNDMEPKAQSFTMEIANRDGLRLRFRGGTNRTR